MTGTLTNREANVKLAYSIAQNADSFEVDVIDASDEDDVLALLSHLDILERNVRKMRDNLRATLEGRVAE